MSDMEVDAPEKGSRGRSRSQKSTKKNVKDLAEGSIEDTDHGFQEYLLKAFPSFLQTIKECIKETDVECLDVGNLNLGSAQIEAILNLLPGTQVTEFRSENNNMLQCMPGFDKQLTKSNLKKLSFKSCSLQVQNVLALMAALSRTKVTDLDLSFILFSEPYVLSAAKTFFKYLKTSHLTHLRLTGSPLLNHSSGNDLVPLLSHLPISHLWLDNTGFSQSKNSVQNLFTELPKTSIIELYLGSNEIQDEQLKPLLNSLKKSSLKTLDLSSNKITDIGVNLLGEASVGSKLSTLILSKNRISGSNNLGNHLKNTSLTKLHLDYNKVENLEMFCFPYFLKGTSVAELHLDHCDLGDEVAQSLLKCLKFSKVSKLNLRGNCLSLLTVTEFSKIVQETDIVEVDFSENTISAEVTEILGVSIKESKVQHFKLTGGVIKQEGLPAATLIEKCKGALLESLDISNTNFEDESVMLTTSLKNTTLTHLNLSSCLIGAGLYDLAPILKHTAITHLNLSENKIDDVGALKLAEFLKETKIFQLEIQNNSIANKGAEALALCLKSGPLYVLNLSGNKISNNGIQKLASTLKTTYITSLDVSNNAGIRVLPLTTVLWRNRVLLHKMVSFFRIIAPTDGSNFRFKTPVNPNNGTDLMKYFNKCFHFYRDIIEKPSAISALASNQSSPFVAELFEDFPRQFFSFVIHNTKLKTVYPQRVKAMERAQTLGLEKISALFLNHFSTMLLEDRNGILMPEVFRLLEKHKQTMADVVAKPKDKKVILSKFVERPICGLCGREGTLTRLDCCERWLCDGEDVPLKQRYMSRSCSGNHDKWSQCAAHYHNGHSGDYYGCEECIDDFGEDEDGTGFMYDF